MNRVIAHVVYVQRPVASDLSLKSEGPALDIGRPNLRVDRAEHTIAGKRQIGLWHGQSEGTGY